MKSLQNKIFLFFVLLLILVQGVAFWTMYSSNKADEQLTITNRLNNAETLFQTEFDSRSFYLNGFAETVAFDYGLINNFDEDARSLAVALNNHRNRIAANLAMIVDQTGLIRVQLITEKDNEGKTRIRRGSEHQKDFGDLSALIDGETGRFYQLDGNIYKISFSAIKTGPATIGWVGFGFRIDSELANNLSKTTDLIIDFVANDNGQLRSLGSSKAEVDLALSKRIIGNQQSEEVIARAYKFAEVGATDYLVLMHGARDDFVALLQNRWVQLLLLTAMTLMLSLTGAYLIAAGITKPVKALVEQAKKLAAGDYNQTVKIADKSELGQLANEFNVMQQAILARENTISHRAYHDQLTDLPNRNMLKLTLSQLGKQHESFCLMHLNICRLKDVNDTLGHDAGDKVIIEVGKRLNQIKALNLVAHLGADEFAIICQSTTADNISATMDIIHESLLKSFTYQGIALQLQVRVGIAFYPEHQADTLLLLQKADTALHHCRQKRHDFEIYDPSQDSNTVERLSLINDLKTAISDNQLTLFYQPKMNLQLQKVTHVEALVRWFHPTLGMVPPDKFIHLAEQTGQINELTRWVFHEAVKQHLAWREQDIMLNMAINISAENLKDPEFYPLICDCFNEHNLDPSCFTLEVTESAVVDDPEAAIALLSRFKERGIHLSIDDYGTGYSSLAQLKHLPVHELKIDKSFVMKLANDQDDQIIVKSTIELARNMGLTIVAEGVEDEFSLKWLAQHHCTLAQGFFISRPVPADELSTWLADSAEQLTQYYPQLA